MIEQGQGDAAHDRPAHSLSVVVPVYNEAALLPGAIAMLDAFLATHFAEYEIILVESGSTDGSAEIADQLAAELPRLEVIHEGVRRGFGSALKVGFAAATKDLALMTTADEPFRLDTLLAALPLLARYDCVLSYRSRDFRPWPRRLQSIVYNALVRSLLGIPLRHVNSAFKLYRRDVLQVLTVRSDSWFFDAEIVYRIVEAEIPYTVVPVEVIDRTVGTSSIAWGTPLALVKELVAFFRAEGRLRRGPTR